MFFKHARIPGGDNRKVQIPIANVNLASSLLSVSPEIKQNSKTTALIAQLASDIVTHTHTH